MRIKFSKEYLKYYAYAVLGVISIILFYKILDNLGLILSSIGFAISSLFDILLPILLGGVLAYFLFRPMRWLERKAKDWWGWAGRHPKQVRLLAIVIVYFIAICVLVAFLYILIPSIVDSIVTLAGNMPTYMEEINQFLISLSERGGFFKDLTDIIKLDLGNLSSLTAKEILDSLLGNVALSSESFIHIGNLAMLFAKGTTSFFISTIAVFFSGFYLMLDKENIGCQLNRLNKALMNETVYNGFNWVVRTIDDVFYRYFSGKIMTSALIGLICYLGLLLLGVEYAPLIALVVGVTNVIPYFGPIIGAIPGIILTLLYNPVMAIWVALWILIVQQFDGNILGPNVLGRIVELNPFWVLFSVMIGGSIMGPLGMFVAIPFFAVIKVFISEGLTRWETYKEKQQEAVAEPGDPVILDISESCETEKN